MPINLGECLLKAMVRTVIRQIERFDIASTVPLSRTRLRRGKYSHPNKPGSSSGTTPGGTGSNPGDSISGMRGCWKRSSSSGFDGRVTTLMSGWAVWMSSSPRMTGPTSTSSQMSFPLPTSVFSPSSSGSPTRSRAGWSASSGSWRYSCSGTSRWRRIASSNFSGCRPRRTCVKFSCERERREGGFCSRPAGTSEGAVSR